MKSHIIMQGDAWELAKRMPSKSVQCIVTSPPYWGLRSYGGEQNVVWPGNDPKCEHEWDNELLIRRSSESGKSSKQLTNHGANERDIPIPHSTCGRCGAWKGAFGLEPTPDMFVDHLVALFRELRRVLMDNGTLWCNLGDSYNGSGGSTTTTNFGKQYDGKTGSFTAQPRHYSGLKPKDLVGIPWRVAFALQADGWYLRSDIIWHKPNPMPESVTDRPTKAHEYIFLLSKNQRYFYDNEAIKEPLAEASVARYEYSFGGAKNEILKATDNPRAVVGYREPTSGRNKRTVWTVNTKPYKGAHFATFNPALITPCILAGTSEVGNCPNCGNPWVRIVERTIGTSRETPKTQAAHEARGGTGIPTGTVGKSGGGRTDGYVETVGWEPTCTCNKSPVPAVVLDPFAGSGTTLAVALQNGRHAVGFELNPEYIDLAEKRIADAVAEVTVKEIPPLEVQLNDLPLFQERN